MAEIIVFEQHKACISSFKLFDWIFIFLLKLNFDPNEVTEDIEITVTKFKHKPYMNTITLSNENKNR